ncbi:hypothetical protein C0995_012319 [Termitomyces sp. Mi166|nr:hypothetical protein C0995_012319 [Termitomyces sp. Mi166\
MNKLLLVAQKLNKSLLNKTMWALLYDPIYRDLQSPIQGEEDMDFVVPQHILTCFMCVKEDGMTALHVMCTLDPSQPFNLKQIAQYVLIFGWPGLENTWQGIAFDFAYRMHWRTLFGFTLCWALCATSTAKPAVVRMYQESLLDRTVQALLHDPIYKDLQSPIQGEEDMDFVVPRHIPTCFMHVKEDGTTALCVMRTPDPSQPFDLEQIAQYALIFGRPELENTWQGIAFDFAYCMHWQTLFGFTLCQAL